MADPLGPYEDLVALATEGLLAAILLVGAASLWVFGRRSGMRGKPGWGMMVVGLALFGALAGFDFADEFDEELWVVAGLDTEPFVEDLLLPLAAVALLVAGILRWVPMHSRMATLEAAQREAEIARLEQVSAFKTTFLNAASHELATPLTAVRFQLAILRERGGPSTSLDMLDRSVGRLERLVQDLLDSSRIQSGRLRHVLRPTDISGLLADLDPSFAALCAENGIRYSQDAAPGLEVEAADGVRIAQVVDNLVTNAIKFTAAGGEVCVTARREGDEVVVAVEDTGAGLAEDELPGIFEPFQQYHHDLVGAHVGSGLGLYVCQGIAQEHGGTMEARSPGRGQGACFALRLPRAAATRSRPAPRHSADAAGAPRAVLAGASAPAKRSLSARPWR